LRNLEQEFRQQHERQEISLIEKSQGIYDFLDDNQAKLLNGRISEYLNFVRDKAQEYTVNTDTETLPEQPTQVKNIVIELTKELEEKILENFTFWNEQPDGKQGRKNIFKNTKQSYFFKMVQSADFSTIIQKGLSQRIQYNIYVLSRIFGKDWGEKAAKNVGAKSLRECEKKTAFYEHSELKKMYLP
jgi:hypothetical protein